MQLWKCCTQYDSKFGKLSSGNRTGKGQFSFQSQRKAMIRNAQTPAQLHSSHMLVKPMPKFLPGESQGQGSLGGLLSMGLHRVSGFGMVNEAEVDVFLEFSCFFYDPVVVAIWCLVPLPFLNPAWTSGSSRFMYCWSLVWRILSITLLVCAMNAIVQ